MSGIIAVILFKNKEVAEKMARFVNKESQSGSLTPREKANAVEELLAYLKAEKELTKGQSPFYDPTRSGPDYALNAMQRTLDNFNRREAAQAGTENQLDLLETEEILFRDFELSLLWPISEYCVVRQEMSLMMLDVPCH